MKIEDLERLDENGLKSSASSIEPNALVAQENAPPFRKLSN